MYLWNWLVLCWNSTHGYVPLRQCESTPLNWYAALVDLVELPTEGNPKNNLNPYYSVSMDRNICMKVLVLSGFCREGGNLGARVNGSLFSSCPRGY